MPLRDSLDGLGSLPLGSALDGFDSLPIGAALDDQGGSPLVFLKHDCFGRLPLGMGLDGLGSLPLGLELAGLGSQSLSSEPIASALPKGGLGSPSVTAADGKLLATRATWPLSSAWVLLGCDSAIASLIDT